MLRLESDQPSCVVLVVDDDPDSRTILVEMLGEAGFDVLEAGDGLAAVAAFASGRPQLVLMDQQMPGLSGAEATRRIRLAPGGVQVKIIALTANATDQVRNYALAAGADSFMAKPFRAQDLFEEIRLLTRVRYVYSESAVAEAPAGEPPPTLTAEMMDALPAELREQIREAAVRARHSRLLELTGQVAAIDPEMGEMLQQVVARFDFAAMLRVLDRRPS